MQIIDVLTGQRTREGGTVRARRVSTFGIGKELSRAAVARRHSPARRAAAAASGLRPVQHPEAGTGCARSPEWPQDSQAAQAVGEASAATQAQAGRRYPPRRRATRLPANRAMSSRRCASGARAWRRSMGCRRTPCFTMPRCRRSRGCCRPRWMGCVEFRDRRDQARTVWRAAFESRSGTRCWCSLTSAAQRPQLHSFRSCSERPSRIAPTISGVYAGTTHWPAARRSDPPTHKWPPASRPPPR